MVCHFLAIWHWICELIEESFVLIVGFKYVFRLFPWKQTIIIIINWKFLFQQRKSVYMLPNVILSSISTIAVLLSPILRKFPTSRYWKSYKNIRNWRLPKSEFIYLYLILGKLANLQRINYFYHQFLNRASFNEVHCCELC